MSDGKNGFEKTKELVNTDLWGNPIDVNKDLKEMFVIPPFSIFDTRQGYWQNRKRRWKKLINDNGESRTATLFKSSGDPVSEKIKVQGTVSILDPVLAEICVKWFGFDNCNILDPFAGDTVFGYVAGFLNNNFTGIEIRKEQADINQERTKDFNCKYYCDDGQNVLSHVEKNTQDLIFSCPPYFDLEVYSDLKNDASNQKEYNDFLKILDNAFSGAIKTLKDNRFAFIVIGDVRDKNGFYRLMPDDIKQIFKRNGMYLYNDIVLIESIGTGALRAQPNMRYLKVVKKHQNVLVFYKGDQKKIINNINK